MTGFPALSPARPATFDGVYDDIVRRHAAPAWGLACAILRDEEASRRAVERALAAVFAAVDRGSYPAGLSMTAAVLAATRATALVTLHRGAGGGGWPLGTAGSDPLDRAFSSLPECWRSTLWLLDGQRVRPVDASLPLQLAPDDLLDVVDRARAAFRVRYVALATEGRPRPCRLTGEALLAPGGDVPPHRIAAMDQHLAECQECRKVADVLAQPGTWLRATVGRPLPAPLVGPEVASAAPRRSRRQREVTMPELFAVIAAVVVTLLGVVSAGVRHGGASEPGAPVADGRRNDVVRAFSVAPPVPAVLDAAGHRTHQVPSSAVAPPPAVSSAAVPVDPGSDEDHLREGSLSDPETREDVAQHPPVDAEVRLADGEPQAALIVELADVRVEVVVSGEAVRGGSEGSGPAVPQATGSGA